MVMRHTPVLSIANGPWLKKPVLTQRTNQQLIPIYTNWVNYHLAKANAHPINDLTGDLCCPKRLVGLVFAVTCDSQALSQETLLCALNLSDPVESIEKCLKYLTGLGVNVFSIQAKDIRNGHLGSILSLLFALSYFKQQKKAESRLTAPITPSSTLTTHLQEPTAASHPKAKRSKKAVSLKTVSSIKGLKTISSSSGYSSFYWHQASQQDDVDLANSVKIPVAQCPDNYTQNNKKVKREAVVKKPSASGYKRVAFRMPPNSSSSIVSNVLHVDTNSLMEESSTSTICVVGFSTPRSSSTLRPPSIAKSVIPRASKLAAPSSFAAKGPAVQHLQSQAVGLPQNCSLLQHTAPSLPDTKPPSRPSLVLPGIQAPSIHTRQISNASSKLRLVSKPNKPVEDKSVLLKKDVQTLENAQPDASICQLNSGSETTEISTKGSLTVSQLNQRSRLKAGKVTARSSLLRPPSASRNPTTTDSSTNQCTANSTAQLLDSGQECVVSQEGSRVDSSAVPAVSAGITALTTTLVDQAEQPTLSSAEMAKTNRLFGGYKQRAQKEESIKNSVSDQGPAKQPASNSAAFKSKLLLPAIAIDHKSKLSAKEFVNTEALKKCGSDNRSKLQTQKKRAISSPQLVRKTRLMQPNTVSSKNGIENDHKQHHEAARKTLLPASCVASCSSLAYPGVQSSPPVRFSLSPPSTSSSSSLTCSSFISTTSAPPPSLEQSNFSLSSSYILLECEDKEVSQQVGLKIPQLQRPVNKISAPKQSKVQEKNATEAKELNSGMASDTKTSRGQEEVTTTGEISPQQEKRPVLAVKGISVQIQKRPELEDELRRDQTLIGDQVMIPDVGARHKEQLLLNQLSTETEQSEPKPNIGIVSPMLHKPVEFKPCLNLEKDFGKLDESKISVKRSSTETCLVGKQDYRDSSPSVSIKNTAEKIEKADISRFAKVARLKTENAVERKVISQNAVESREDCFQQLDCSYSPVPPPPAILSVAMQRNSKTEDIASLTSIPKMRETSGREHEKIYEKVSSRRRHNEYNDSYEDSSSISSGVSETFDDISTDDLTGSSSDYLPAANPSSMAVFREDPRSTPRFREVNKPSSHHNNPYIAGLGSNQPPAYHHRQHSSNSQQNSVEELLQRCRTSQRGNAFYSDAQTRRPASTTNPQHQQQRQLHPVEYYQLQQQRGSFPLPKHYHTIQIPPNNFPRQPPPRILSPPPQQLLLFGDAEEQMMSANKATFSRPIYRRHQQPECYSEAKKQEQELYQLPNTIAYHTHSLDRNSHLKIFSLASTSEATRNEEILLSAPSSPYRISSHNGQTDRQQNMLLIPGYGEDEASLSRGSISGTLSTRVTSNEQSQHSASSSIYANGLHLHKLSSDLIHSSYPTDNNMYLNFKPPSNPQGSISPSSEEKYTIEMRKLLHEMNVYRSTILQLSAKNKDYTHLIHMFDGKLGLMVRHVENLQQKSQLKQEEIDKLRQQIEHLRLMSCNAGLNLPPTQSNGGIIHYDGAGEQLLLRRPCSPAESVLSQKSAMSTTSTSNKIPKLAFQTLTTSNGSIPKKIGSEKDTESSRERSGKKSWIRSSFNKAFHKASGNGNSNGKNKSKLNPPSNGSISDIEHSPIHTARSGRLASANSTTRLENSDPNSLIPIVQMVELKKQLEDKDLALTDVRLDALDKAREVDILRETVHRLKNENKILKHNFTLLERRIRDDSRASSHQSLSTCCHDEGEPHAYDMPGGSCTGSGSASVKDSTSGFTAALSVAESRCHSSSSFSKRSSGGVNIRVTLCLDVSGKLDSSPPAHPPLSIANSSSASPHVGGSSSTISSTASFASSHASNKRELTIGYLGASSVQHSTWEDMDQQLGLLLEEYLHRIDPDMTLGVDSYSSIIGYQLIGSREVPEEVLLRARAVDTQATAPSQTPAEALSTTLVIKLRLQGAVQDSMDALVLESLFPKSTLEQLLHSLLQSRRLVIYGATGIGKSNLARYLAKYLAEHLKIESKNIADFRFPDDEKDFRTQQVQQQLVSALKMEKGEQQIILLDNIQRKKIGLMTAAFLTADQSNSQCLGVQAALILPEAATFRKQPFVIVTLNRTSESPVQNLQLHHGFKLFSLNSKMDAVKGYMGRYLRRRITEEEMSETGSQHFRSNNSSDQLQCVIEFLNKSLSVVNDFIEKANAFDVTLGPRIFLQCPLNMEDSRMWFIELWNHKIVPYMTKVARDSMNFLGSRGILKDPTLYVCEHWPWFDDDSGAGVLRHILPMVEPIQESCLESVRQVSSRQHYKNGSIANNSAIFPAAVPADFDPIYALERIEESRKI